MSKYAPEYAPMSVPFSYTYTDDIMPLWYTASLQCYAHNMSIWREYTGKDSGIGKVSDRSTGFNQITGKHYAELTTYDEKGNIVFSSRIESATPLKVGQIRAAFAKHYLAHELHDCKAHDRTSP